MTLTHKERMRRALNHEPVDRLPTQINYTDEMGDILVEHFGVSHQELPARFDNRRNCSLNAASDLLSGLPISCKIWFSVCSGAIFSCPDTW